MWVRTLVSVERLEHLNSKDVRMIIEHGSLTHSLIRKWAVTDEQQNGVCGRAVNCKCAFVQMADRYARIACRINPQCFV